MMVRAMACVAAAVMLAGCGGEEEVTWSRPTDAQASAQPTPAASPREAPPLDSQGSSPAPAPGAAAAGPVGAMGIPEPPPVEVKFEDSFMTVGGVSWSVPEGWKSREPSSSMRVAEFDIPGEAGAGEAIFFYFGPGQGGSAEQNVRRWVGQFTPDEDTTGVQTTAAEFDYDGIRVALVKASGTYTPSTMMPGAPAQPPQANHALFGAVFEGGPAGSIFMRATGPKATMDAQDDAFESFVKSVRKTGVAQGAAAPQ